MSSVETITLHGVPVFGKGVEPTVGAPVDATGNSLVNILNFTVEYNGGQLQVTAVVQPVNPADTIMSLIVAATPTTAPFTVLAGSNTAMFGADSPGVAVAGMAFSGLWNPEDGTEVIASINGLIFSGGKTQSYGSAQTLTVGNA